MTDNIGDFIIMEPNEAGDMETLDGYSWFLMQCSWEPEHDSQAITTYFKVYFWFRWNKKLPTRIITDYGLKKPKFRHEISDKGFLALNLISQRKFNIAGQAKSNKPLQELSALITLGTHIKVDLYTATNVFELTNLMPSPQITS